ncbi:hypothetical protein VP01_639g3 [Puccinia sorghi]|uniref:Uncharacterized protein n=1 Tax=Puccinia sorghi TaxID=27349 RepID=A0A0L6UI07_9BASI|nr:hypothetical protein VP01_639g3 [Puccinia sorghi]
MPNKNFYCTVHHPEDYCNNSFLVELVAPNKAFPVTWAGASYQTDIESLHTYVNSDMYSNELMSFFFSPKGAKSLIVVVFVVFLITLFFELSRAPSLSCTNGIQELACFEIKNVQSHSSGSHGQLTNIIKNTEKKTCSCNQALMHSHCAKTSKYANRWSLDDSLAGALHVICRQLSKKYLSKKDIYLSHASFKKKNEIKYIYIHMFFQRKLSTITYESYQIDWNSLSLDLILIHKLTELSFTQDNIFLRNCGLQDFNSCNTCRNNLRPLDSHKDKYTERLTCKLETFNQGILFSSIAQPLRYSKQYNTTIQCQDKHKFSRQLSCPHDYFPKLHTNIIEISPPVLPVTNQKEHKNSSFILYFSEIPTYSLSSSGIQKTPFQQSPVWAKDICYIFFCPFIFYIEYPLNIAHQTLYNCPEIPKGAFFIIYAGVPYIEKTSSLGQGGREEYSREGNITRGYLQVFLNPIVSLISSPDVVAVSIRQQLFSTFSFFLKIFWISFQSFSNFNQIHKNVLLSALYTKFFLNPCCKIKINVFSFRGLQCPVVLGPLAKCTRCVHSLNSRSFTLGNRDDSSSCNLHTQTRTPTLQSPRTVLLSKNKL